MGGWKDRFHVENGTHTRAVPAAGTLYYEQNAPVLTAI